MDSLVERITELVLLELAGREPTAPPPAPPAGRRVMLCPVAASRASDPVWEALRSVAGVSWQVLVWPGFPTSLVEARLAGRPWKPVSACPDEAVAGVEAVVLPSTTLEVLPRLALLLGDIPPVQMAVAALVQGTPLLAAPEEVDRYRRHAARMPAGVVSVVGQHLRTVESMGVRFLEAEALARELQGGAQPPASTPARGRDVVTREDILAAARAGSRVFEAAGGSIVTPLAAQTAREQGIEVRLR